MKKEPVTFSCSDGRLHAVVACELDHHTAKGVRERIDREVFFYRPRVLVLDMSGVGFMDSSGIALILGRVEVARAVGGSVHLSGLSPQLRKLVGLSGIERVAGLTVGP